MSAGFARGKPATPFFLLIVITVLAGLTATLLAVIPQSHAEEVNGVQVSHNATEAAISESTGECVIKDRISLNGDSEAVSRLVSSWSESARAAGLTVTTGGVNPAPGASATDLIMSRSFDLAAAGADASQCTTDQVVAEHRGRAALELPAWARGMVAAAAGISVYLVVVFSVTALFTFLAPEFAVYGEIIGGCIGGFASTYVSNLINKVDATANLVGSAVQCIAGALLNVTLGAVKTQMVEKMRNYLGTAAPGVVGEGVSGSAGHAVELSDSFRSAASQLSDELATAGSP